MPGGLTDNPGLKSNASLIFPNPNNGSFTFGLKSNLKDVTIDLYTTNGKLVDSFPCLTTPTQVNAHGLTEGIYFVRARTMNQNSTSKMIIKK